MSELIKKTFLMDQYNKTWEEGEWDGDERTEVEVTELSQGKFQLTCAQYYHQHGEFIMIITQPLERALQTFLAALIMDGQLEAEEIRTEEMR
jgi:hypothetical protein